jgi:hypothetical protein
MREKLIIRAQRNIQIAIVIVIGLVFVIVDGIQLFFYPMIFFGFLKSIEAEIRNQLPMMIKSINLIWIFSLLVINVLLRVIAIRNIFLERKNGLFLGLTSNAFTVLIVVFVLTANRVWESIVMSVLSMLLVWGYKMRNLNLSPNP